MAQDNLVSIVIPVYNLVNYLERCVRSVQNQSYSNIEIILVDNGSVDGSYELVDRLASEDSRIIPIHEESQGVTHARLTGVKNANGNWIGFVDGDDLIEPDMYERLLKKALQYNAQISHCGYQMVFDDGRVNYFYNTGHLVQQDKLTGLKDLLDGSYIEPGLCNKLFHKNLFHSLLHDDMMDLSIKNNEDLLMNFLLFKEADKSVYHDFCPYHYIVRQQSASRGIRNSHKTFDPIKVKELILSYAPEELKQEAEKAYITTCISAYSSLSTEKTTQEIKRDKEKVRKLIIEHKDMLSPLGIKQKFLGRIIVYCPLFFTPLYRVYSRFFLHSPYN